MMKVKFTKMTNETDCVRTRFVLVNTETKKMLFFLLIVCDNKYVIFFMLLPGGTCKYE